MITMPDQYTVPLGHPMYWADETSGFLAEAVEAYIAYNLGTGPQPGHDHLEAFRAYLVHWIRAPYWRMGATHGGKAFERQLALWIEEAREIRTVRCAQRFLAKIQPHGMNPLKQIE